MGEDHEVDGLKSVRAQPCGQIDAPIIPTAAVDEDGACSRGGIKGERKAVGFADRRKIYAAHRMKLVCTRGSGAGCSSPFARLISSIFSIHAMLRPSARMHCRPSASCFTSSGVEPCTMFQ